LTQQKITGKNQHRKPEGIFKTPLYIPQKPNKTKGGKKTGSKKDQPGGLYQKGEKKTGVGSDESQ